MIMVSKAIVNAYVRRIKRGVITIDAVPVSIREQVSEALKEVDSYEDQLDVEV